MFTYAIIKTDNKIEVFHSDVTPEYEVISQAVGGWIEGVSLEGVTAYINEEGKIISLPANSIATVIAHKDRAIMPWDIINGNMYVAGPLDDEGGETSLPQEWLDKVKNDFGFDYMTHAYGDAQAEVDAFIDTPVNNIPKEV